MSEGSGCGGVHYLPIADSILRQIRDIEDKQRRAVEKVNALKVSVFYSMLKELEQVGADRHDKLRFTLFWEYVDMVLRRSTVSVMFVARDQVLCGLTGGNGYDEIKGWLCHWEQAGLLVSERTVPRHWARGMTDSVPDATLNTDSSCREGGCDAEAHLELQRPNDEDGQE